MLQAARDPRLTAAFALLLLVALALRIAGATGELWLDEIWSLHLIDRIRSGVVLPSIATDNNHYLNTLYLSIVGGGGPPLIVRGFSILLGTATVAAAGWLQRERGLASVVAAMALFAVTYPLVNAGSEARGYAGMLLCALLAIAAVERARDHPSQRSRLLSGIVNVLGVLFQPLMLAMVASLGIWVGAERWRAAGSRAACRTVSGLFVWTVRLLIPVVVIIGVAVHFGRNGYVLGGVSPFDPGRMTNGIAHLFRFLLGLPEATPMALVLAIVLAVIRLAVWLRRPGDRRIWLYLIVIFVMPAAMAIAHLPNTEIPRYYLLPGIAFLLLASDLFGTLWTRGTAARIAATLAFVAIVLGNAFELAQFFEVGRGDVKDMLAIVARHGAGPITSNTELRDQPVIEYFIDKQGMDASFVNFSDVCRTHPRWILSSDLHDELPDDVTIGGPACDLRFRKQAHYDTWGLSGFPWTLYRAE